MAIFPNTNVGRLFSSNSVLTTFGRTIRAAIVSVGHHLPAEQRVTTTVVYSVRTPRRVYRIHGPRVVSTCAHAETRRPYSLYFNPGRACRGTTGGTRVRYVRSSTLFFGRPAYSTVSCTFVNRTNTTIVTTIFRGPDNRRANGVPILYHNVVRVSVPDGRFDGKFRNSTTSDFRIIFVRQWTRPFPRGEGGGGNGEKLNAIDGHRRFRQNPISVAWLMTRLTRRRWFIIKIRKKKHPNRLAERCVYTNPTPRKTDGRADGGGRRRVFFCTVDFVIGAVQVCPGRVPRERRYYRDSLSAPPVSDRP